MTGPLLIRPDRMFDGHHLRSGVAVLVHGGVIVDIGPDLAVPDVTIVDAPGQTLPATPARYPAMAVARDGTWLATTDSNGTVRIWNPHNGQGGTGLRTAGAFVHLQRLDRAVAAGGRRGLCIFELHRPVAGDAGSRHRQLMTP